MKKRLTVLNGTNEVTNQDIGRIRVIESESGIEVKHHITARERLVSDYSHFAIETAQSTVEMCRVVFEANEQLSKEEFSKFCIDIGQKRTDSTIRKYLAIGAAYERLIQYVDKLPSKWTSIYTILQIPSETFNALIQVGESFAKLTGDQIKALSRDATSTVETTTEVTSSETTTTSSTEDSQKSLESNSETSSEVSSEVTASTDEISTDEDSSNLSTRDDSDDESVSEAAVVKVNALLERVTTTASTSMKVEDEVEDEFQPYELLLCFNSVPSNEAKQYLVDCIYTLKLKYRVDIELKSQEEVLY
jgi:hypothetical protein